MTVRGQSEGLLNRLPVGQCTLIRVNPDFPELSFYTSERFQENTVGIQATGLETILAIDKKMKEKLNKT